MEEIKSEDGMWDKKKIVGALLILLVLGVGIKMFVLDDSANFSKTVKGVSVKPPSSSEDQETPVSNFDLQKTLREKLEGIKAEVQNINLADIASSSPQMQKALNDLKALEEYPKNQAKELCQKICSSF